MDVRVTLGSKEKCRKCTNVIFLALYFSISDMQTEIKDLVY